MSFQIHVAIDNNVTDAPAKCHRNRNRAGFVFDCVPPVKGVAVQVNTEGNSTLAICDVCISGIGKIFSDLLQFTTIEPLLTGHPRGIGK